MAAEDHVLGSGCAWWFGCARDLGDGVEDRHLTEEAGLGVDAQHRLLTVLGQPVDEAVSLTAQVQQRRPLRSGAEDLVHAPPFRPLRPDDSGGPGNVQRCRQLAPLDTRALLAFGPRLDRALALLGHAGQRLGPGEPLQVVPRAATRLRPRDQDELADDLREPRLERFGAVRVRQDHHARLDGPVGGRAPGGRHALQRPHPR